MAIPTSPALASAAELGRWRDCAAAAVWSTFQAHKRAARSTFPWAVILVDTDADADADAGATGDHAPEPKLMDLDKAARRKDANRIYYHVTDAVIQKAIGLALEIALSSSATKNWNFSGVMFNPALVGTEIAQEATS